MREIGRRLVDPLDDRRSCGATHHRSVGGDRATIAQGMPNDQLAARNRPAANATLRRGGKAGIVMHSALFSGVWDCRPR